MDKELVAKKTALTAFLAFCEGKSLIQILVLSQLSILRTW